MHKVRLAVIGIAIGAAIVAAFAGASAKADLQVAVKQVAVKSDRLPVGRPEASCAQIPWPYGCRWREPASTRSRQQVKKINGHGRHALIDVLNKIR